MIPPNAEFKPQALEIIKLNTLGNSEIFNAITATATKIYAIAMKGTMISAALPILLTPPNIIKPKNAIITRPVTNGVIPNAFCTPAAIEFD